MKPADGSDTEIEYTYDANGSCITKTTKDSSSTVVESVTYDYNLRNKLCKVTTDPISGSTVSVTEYTYNDEGIRVKAYSYDMPRGGGTKSNEKTTTFLIDAYNHTGYAQVLEEDDGTIRMTYTIGDDVVTQSKYNGSTATARHLICDGQGSTRQLTDSSGNVAANQVYNYDAYGSIINSVTPATTLLYSGEYYDADIDKYNLRSRLYDPPTGRFITSDNYPGSPQDPVSLHKYLYCHANPINGIDPTGEFVDFTVIGQAVVNSIQATLRRTESFYTLHVAPRVYFNLYRAFNLYNWGMAQLPKVFLGLTAADLGLTFVDDAATAWLNNNQPVPVAPVDRGMMLHRLANANLSDTFPVIDNWDNRFGIATSMKTHGAASPEGLLQAIKTDLRAIDVGTSAGAKPLVGQTATGAALTIAPSQIQMRTLLVGVPWNQATWLQVQEFRDNVRMLQAEYSTVIRTVPVKGWKK